MSQGFTKDYIVKATGETEITKYLTPVVRSSGTTEATFTLPSGVKKFDLCMMNVGSDGTQNMRIRLGDATSVKATGYASVGWRTGASSIAAAGISSYFSVERSAAGDNFDGVVSFTLADPTTNTWVAQGQLADQSSGNQTHGVNGAISLDSELTTLQIDFSSDDWDGDGLFYVSYENPDLAVSGNSSTPAGVTEVTKFLTQQSLASGTDTKTFTIPASVKRFSLHINRADVTAGSDILIQIGGAGGLMTSGYRTSDTLLTAATATTGDGDDGWHLPRSAAGDDIHGTAEFWLQDPVNHIWAMSFMGADLSDDKLVLVAGTQNDLGEELTTVALNPNGSTWDGTGAFVGCSYENPYLDLGSGVISGGVVQTVNTQDGEVATGTTVLPYDDTIPAITDGNEWMSASITPKDVANKLRVDVVVSQASDSVGNPRHSIALHQDGGAGIAAMTQQEDTSNANRQQILHLTHWMDAGTTSSTTFSVRGGVDDSGTITFNGSAAARKFGGVMASSITITEYKA